MRGGPSSALYPNDERVGVFIDSVGRSFQRMTLVLTIGEPVFQLIGGNYGDAPWTGRATDAGPVIRGLGFQRYLGTDW